MRRAARFAGILLLSILIATLLVMLSELAGFSIVAQAE